MFDSAAFPHQSKQYSLTPKIKMATPGARSIRPKFPKIPVQNRMEQKISRNSFRKFRSTSQGCPFFWKFGNSGNFLFHLAFLSGMISALVSLVVNFASTKAKDGGESTLHWMQNDLPQFEPVLDCQSSTKAIGFDFLENCGLVVSNFLWISSPTLHTLS